MIDVSIIIPVYKAEQWVERCVHSLFSQSLKEIEFIIVDDCTPDNSIEIIQAVLDEYPERKEQVKIIRHKENQGVAASRTNGMLEAKGKFIIHCDPDDWVEHDIYKSMYNAAIEKDVDIVTCDYYTESSSGTLLTRNNYFSSNPHECIKNMYSHYFFPSLWATLIKRDIIIENKIYPFKDINTGEDLNVVLRAFYYGKKIYHLASPLYHYYRHDGSLSMNKDFLSLFNQNIFPNLTLLENFFNNNDSTKEDYSVMLNFLKFKKKMILLSCGELRMWYTTWQESNKDLSKYVSIPKKTRMIYGMCSKSYVLLWLYFKVIRKLIP